jgi:bifunctional non-homologous end joining protein LigD
VLSCASPAARASLLVHRPPAEAGWRHDVKPDGFRILALKLGERVKVWSRREADFTYHFTAIADPVRGLSADEAAIDSEAVNDGRS